MNETRNGKKKGLALHLMGHRLFIEAGSYHDRPKQAFGIKLAKEINAACDVSLPIPDFKTPEEAELRDALRDALRLLIEGKRVYVGCMAGRGRTGLFLACLAKACGYKQPIAYVRRWYNEHAVETSDQAAFVADLRVADLWVEAAGYSIGHRTRAGATSVAVTLRRTLIEAWRAASGLWREAGGVAAVRSAASGFAAGIRGKRGA